MSVSEPQELISVLNQMEYWRQEPVKDRKRAFKRFSVRGDATIEPIAVSQVYPQHVPVMLRDISRGGIGFVLDEFIQPGSTWRIALYNRGCMVGTQTLVVRYCRLVQDGLYLVGAQFIVEPYLMVMLGVDEGELVDDIADRAGPQDTADFIAPDAIDESDGE